jgi:hypothetical protein
VAFHRKEEAFQLSLNIRYRPESASARAIVGWAPPTNHLTLLWQIDGIDPGFDNSAVATPPLQTVGPFTMGQTIRFKPRAENASGTTDGAEQEIEIT